MFVVCVFVVCVFVSMSMTICCIASCLILYIFYFVHSLILRCNTKRALHTYNDTASTCLSMVSHSRNVTRHKLNNSQAHCRQHIVVVAVVVVAVISDVFMPYVGILIHMYCICMFA